MKLYWAPQTRAMRAVWMLEEAKTPYERIRIDIRDPATKTDAFLAASPMGKVPALEDGPVRIWDSGAICGYVADQYPTEKLGAADRPSRSGALSHVAHVYERRDRTGHG